jgi:hypothetical protein
MKGAAIAISAALLAGTTIVALAPGAGATPAPPAVTRPPSHSATAATAKAPICYFGACYNYVAASQYVNASGASITMLQAQPELDPSDGDAHSLQELAIESTDGQQIVEVGWTVDRGLNGDALPHLFTFHWINGQPTCYNACNFVSTSSTKPGDPVTVGTSAEYGIVHRTGKWWITYGGHNIGYYPDSEWNGTFTQFGLVQAFGEVASQAKHSCSDMGNGRRGTRPTSSMISSFTLTRGDAAPNLQVTTVSTPGQYNSGFATATSYHLGGPGNGVCGS